MDICEFILPIFLILFSSLTPSVPSFNTGVSLYFNNHKEVGEYVCAQNADNLEITFE